MVACVADTASAAVALHERAEEESEMCYLTDDKESPLVFTVCIGRKEVGEDPETVERRLECVPPKGLSEGRGRLTRPMTEKYCKL